MHKGEVYFSLACTSKKAIKKFELNVEGPEV